MNDKAFNTPILFIIFNRPDCTQRVFEIIKTIRPKKLFVAADGPRLDKPGEKERCAEVREIVSKIGWDCELNILFRESNVGCKKAESGAMDWFFEQVEEGIVLEDDCLPDPTFFQYCEELLIKYRYNDQIAFISGHNVQFGKNSTKDSYYFSNLGDFWGWASWRRSWKYYDVNIDCWPNIRDEGRLYKILGNKSKVNYWTTIFNRVYNGEINTWDYQWVLINWLRNVSSIVPNVNLVSNIGMAHQYATHAYSEKRYSNIPLGQMIFPMRHPTEIKQNKKADDFSYSIFFPRKQISIRISIINMFKSIVNKFQKTGTH